MAALYTARPLSQGCEPIVFQSHWVLVVMDQFTRRIVGFGVQRGNVDGPVLCRMFNRVVLEHP